MIFSAYLKSFLFQSSIMIPMKKYKNRKNQAVLNFLKNNPQICVLKKESKKYNRDLIRKAV